MQLNPAQTGTILNTSIMPTPKPVTSVPVSTVAVTSVPYTQPITNADPPHGTDAKPATEQNSSSLYNLLTANSEKAPAQDAPQQPQQKDTTGTETTAVTPTTMWQETTPVNNQDGHLPSLPVDDGKH